MANQDIERYFDKYFGKYFISSKFIGEFEYTDQSRTDFNNGYESLPFAVEVEEEHFKNATIVFDMVNARYMTTRIITSVSIKPSKVYPIPVGFCGMKRGDAPSFVPLIGPQDPDTIKEYNYPPWHSHWFFYKLMYGGSLDNLSLFLNGSIKPGKFAKSYNTSVESQLGNEKFSFSMYNSLIMEPSPITPGEVDIHLIELGFYRPWKEHFFFKHNFKKSLAAISFLAEKYQEFVNQDKIIDYPVDSYLNGFEALLCNNCRSLTIPNTVSCFGGFKLKVSYLTDALKLIPPVIAGKTKCPQCGVGGRYYAFIDNEKTLDVIGDLIWRCKDDLTPLEIVSNKEKKNKRVIKTICPTCQKKEKKVINLRYFPRLAGKIGEASENVAFLPDSKQLVYKYEFQPQEMVYQVDDTVKDQQVELSSQSLMTKKYGDIPDGGFQDDGM